MAVSHPTRDVSSCCAYALCNRYNHAEIKVTNLTQLNVLNSNTTVNPKNKRIPNRAGVVGYITNVLALEMTFRPIEFFGPEIFRIKNQPWGLFGWQGIIPTKAEKMASGKDDLNFLTVTPNFIADLFNSCPGRITLIFLFVFSSSIF